MFGVRRPPSGLVALGLAVLVVASASVAAAGTAANPTLSASSATTTVDEETTVNVTVSEVPDGLSGFNVTLQVADPDVGSVVDASINDEMGLEEVAIVDDGAGVRLKAVDIDDVVQSGDGPVTLATVTLRGDATGSSALTIDVDQVDDDDGNRIDPALGDASLTVEDGSSDPTTTEQPTGTSTATTTERQTETSTEQPTRTQPTVETTADDGPTPGFGVALVAVALLATAAIGARRQ
jgi:hypothetical protein